MKLHDEGLKPSGKPYTVVICDDKRTDAQTVRQALESRSYKVKEIFENGRDLINWYHQNAGDVDVIVLDIVMPVLDGYAAFFELMKIEPKPRIVFVSVENTSSLIKSVLSLGAYDYLTKPLKRDVILERIGKVVRRPAPE